MLPSASFSYLMLIPVASPMISVESISAVTGVSPSPTVIIPKVNSSFNFVV